MIVFGPVPSRRLGKSLGINNIPVKICTYACVYCQIGRTLQMTTERRKFYDPNDMVRETKEKIDGIDDIDYITFVPDGEPTLDTNLGKEIELLKNFGKVAVITNASLLWREDVRNDLMKADLVSIKVDAMEEPTWKKINRPHPKLEFSRIIDGIKIFAEEYRGTIITETMLIDGIEYGDEIKHIADFVGEIGAKKAYIAVPTRPPAEPWVRAAKPELVAKAYDMFSRILKTEYLVGYEGNEFAAHGNLEDDILSIPSVHPMRKEAVEKLLAKDGKTWDEVERLIREGKLVEVDYEGKKFYMRKIKSRQ